MNLWWWPSGSSAAGSVLGRSGDRFSRRVSWLVRSGASVKAMQRMLGHATAAITLDTYAGLFDQDLDDLVERLQGMLVAA